VGYLRFDETASTAEISVCVDPRFRGRGCGPAVIRAGVQALLSERPDLVPVALVRTDNVASARAFASAGFVPVRELSIRGVSAVEMRLARCGDEG